MAVAARKGKPVDPESAGGPAFRTFFRIADRWKLSPDEQMTLLGLTSRSTYYKWRNEPPKRLTPDLLERLSYIFGIYKNLRVLLPDSAAADAWLRKSNSTPLFNGRSALDRLLSGHVADLYVVRRYLDAERGGWS
ncbi:MAG: DUF2384 domain-containing protein [Gemmatimonas sp.]|nr:DUF2384 domain-containing protein [Gemmatimonas sp.]